MTRYLLIASRDPFESRGAPGCYELAKELSAKEQEVTLFLVQNAVLGSRASVPDNPLAALLGGKIEVLADDLSLRERGISDKARLGGVRVASIDELVDRMLEKPNTKILWH